MSRYLAVIADLPAPPATSWSDYWVVRKDCVARVHQSGRRKLYYPDQGCPVPLEDLTTDRITSMKSYPDNITTRVHDNWKTAGWNQRPSDRSWTGHTVFPLKDKTPPTKQIKGKQPKTVIKPTDFDFTKDDLKPGTKITVQPQLQLAEQQDKRKAEKPEGDYEEPRRGEEGTTLEDKMPENSQEARKAKGLKAPTMPSESERKLHELTHLPYRD